MNNFVVKEFIFDHDYNNVVHYTTYQNNDFKQHLIYFGR